MLLCIFLATQHVKVMMRPVSTSTLTCMVVCRCINTKYIYCTKKLLLYKLDFDTIHIFDALLQILVYALG